MHSGGSESNKMVIGICKERKRVNCQGGYERSLAAVDKEKLNNGGIIL